MSAVSRAVPVSVRVRWVPRRLDAHRGGRDETGGAKVLCSEVTCPRPETVVVVVVEGQR